MNRRDFLKLATTLPLLPLVDAASTKPLPQNMSADPQRPNIIILLFDALSASNMSLYGYPRRTDRYLTQFAKHATVYHAHHSAANSTTPSTASLFTGTYTWTNRVFYPRGLITKQVIPNNLFKPLADSYFMTGFAQNPLADVLLHQYHDYLDYHVNPDKYSLIPNTYYHSLFPNDGQYASKTLNNYLYPETGGSIFLSSLNMVSLDIRKKIYNKLLVDRYYNGIPGNENFNLFTLEGILDGIMRILSELPSPFFAYIHLFPPHGPYRPYTKFKTHFDDNWKPVDKGEHPLGNDIEYNYLAKVRTEYDRYIASLDFEFGNLHRKLDQVGLLDNSYLIVTSDHGQLFERGVHGHSTPFLYEPVIHVPLIVSEPKQRERRNVFLPTSTVDLMPTLLHISGAPIPDRCEGRILPGLGGDESPDRSVFAVEAKRIPAQSPLKKGTFALIKGPYKLIYYLGYYGYKDVYELYNLENDPEEMENLFPQQTSIGREMQAELRQKLEEVNRPFLQNQ